MITINKIMTVVLFICANVILAQDSKVEKGHENFENYSFSPAIDIYKKVAEQGYQSPELYQRIADSYYFKGDLNEAAAWYEKLYNSNKNLALEYYFRYAHALKAIGNINEARKIMDEFVRSKPTDNRSIILASNQNYLNKIEKNSNRYNISLLKQNTVKSDYGAAFYKNKIVFASARDTGVLSKNIHKWDNESFTELYVASIEKDGQLSNPTKFSKTINSKFHEATPALSPDGKSLYFTRNNYIDKKRKKDNEGLTRLKIYRATLNSANEWVNIIEMPFNSDAYSCAHPSLNSSGDKMYFASDMPGTMGASDIFEVDLFLDGTVGTPKNLGREINTEGRETFPYVSGDGILYFSSDGLPGLGGLDIFAAKIENDSTFSFVENVGKPINSSMDDFNYIININNRLGYFSSNRLGGKGGDDIYTLEELSPLNSINTTNIVIIVKDLDTKEVLANAVVSLKDLENIEVKNSNTNAKGSVAFDKIPLQQYLAKVKKEGYATNEKIVNAFAEEQIIYLEKEIYEASLGDDLGKILKLSPILFDTNKWNIRGDAGFEIAKVVAAMTVHPKLKIAIRSHTDNRGTAQSNMILSEKRAQSTMAFMMSKGISADRLTAKGYGESEPVIACEDLNCTDEALQKNRRSEFIIVE